MRQTTGKEGSATKGKSAPLVFDIRGFSLDDGPGIRTTVFLKGCPLSCVWCQNPESWKPEKQMAFYPDLCLGCGECTGEGGDNTGEGVGGSAGKGVCREGAIGMNIPGRIDTNKCTACGRCAKTCPSKALKVVGTYYAPDELIGLLLKNRIFYQTSNGGVTFSGGEPTLHMDYLEEVARSLKENGVHIALQTCGLFDLAKFKKKLLPYLDLIYYDIKIIDAAKHKKYTGVGNQVILDNFIALHKIALQAEQIKIMARTPLIPGLTDSEANLRAIANFLENAGCTKHITLPYNPLGLSKRLALGSV